jgi:uncharacterized membrane protein YdjX (TVP38/TMEM64 family)
MHKDHLPIPIPGEDPSPDYHRRTPGDWVRALLPFSLALLVSLGVILLFTRFQDKIETLKGYGYLGAFFIGLLSNATVILPAPSLAFTTALGVALNPLLVGIAAGAGEALGEMTGYLGGISGKAIIENHAHYALIKDSMVRYGERAFFLLALIPNPLFDLAGIAAGVVRFSIWRFLLSVWAGKTLKAILFAGLGRKLLS